MVTKVKDQSKKVVELINEKFNLARTDDNNTLIVNHEGQHFVLGSRDCIEEIRNEFFRVHGAQPFTNDLNKAVMVIRQQALAEGRTVRLISGNFTRIGDRVYFNQQNGNQEEVTADGRKTVAVLDSPVIFMDGQKNAFVPPSKPDQSLQEILGKYVNLVGDQLLLMVCCLIKAFMPGPDPLMLFIGPQGAGKTWASRIFRMIVDPGDTGNRVRVLDNLSAISGKLSDDLCRASHSWISLITTISPSVPNQDLVDRTIVFDFQQIPDDNRNPETKLLASLEKDLPFIMWWLFSAVSSALKQYQSVDLASYPRLADFVQAVVTACPGLDINVDDFMRALAQNRNDLVERSLNQNPVSAAVLIFMDALEENSWSGTATELLKVLTEKVEDDIKQHGNWPSRSNKLSEMVNRSLPFLQTRGIDVMWGKSGQRSITLMKMIDVSEEQPSDQTTMADFIERQDTEETASHWAGSETEAKVDSFSNVENEKVQK